MNRIARGDHERASVRLYKHYHPPLTRYLWMRLRDEGTAQEIAHETLVVAITEPMKYNNTCEYSTWLVGIADNKLREHWRKEKRAAARHVDGGEEHLAALPSVGLEQFVGTSESEMRQRLASCMDSLPAAYRAVVAMHYFAEQHIGEVAAELGIPPGTVKSRLNKARALLKSCLARKHITGMDS